LPKKPAADPAAQKDQPSTAPAKPPGMVNRPDENTDQKMPVLAAPGKNLIESLYTGMVEQTYTVSPYVPDSMRRPYNPDELFRKRNDYAIYEEMVLDDQVNICLQLKKDLVLGGGWDIVVDSEDDTEESGDQEDAQEPGQTPAKPQAKPFAFPPPAKPQPDDQQPDPNDPNAPDPKPVAGLMNDLAKQIKQELEVSLSEQCDGQAKGQPGDFDEMLAEILTSYEFGFSLTEKVFKINPDGKLGLKYLRTRHPASWLIHTDDQGSIEKYEQRVGAGTAEKGRGLSGIDVDPMSLIHYINNPRFQNPYGMSDLRVAYNAWFVKRQVIKYFGIFLEKSAGPIPWAQYDLNAPQQAIDDIYNALKSFQAKTALVVPKALEVAFLESKNNGEAYDRAIHLFNMFIGRALFIPDLLGFQGKETGGGSYALGKDQIRIFLHHIGRRRKKLENIVNLHIIRPMVLYNYGEMEQYPKFKLRPLDDELAVELAKVWVSAVTAPNAAFKPNPEEINYFRSLCKFPEGEVILNEPAPTQPNDPTTGMPLHPNDPRNPNSPTHPMNSKDPKVAADAQKKAAATPLVKPEPDQPGQKKKFSLTGRYDKKVNFAAIEHAMDRFKSRVTGESAPIAKAAMRDLYYQIESRIGDHHDRVSELTDVAIAPQYQSAIRKILTSNFVAAHTEARTMAADELQQKNYTAPLPDDKFLQFLAGESDIFVNDWAGNLTKEARARVIAAIRDGTPISSIMDAGVQDGQDTSDVAIERYARTKFTDVMNRGRMEYFNDTGIVRAYEYSAILDDRTTDICAGLHGKVFEAADAPVPPLHFNCRSLLVPITKYEEYEADTEVDGQNIDRFISENKGDGFPTK
jgi:SPP1 gp7 family putative phage head morphogenesis protein